MKDRDTTATSSCIKGYHIYKAIWSPSVGDKLECHREPTNIKDCYAVAVVYKCHMDVDDDDTTVGHLLWRISGVCSLFLRHGGCIECKITTRRRYSSDLSQGGLEIPCLRAVKQKFQRLRADSIDSIIQYNLLLDLHLLFLNWYHLTIWDVCELLVSWKITCQQ